MHHELDKDFNEIVYGLNVPQEALKLVIWYHDAVYDTRRKDNEKRSAELFHKHSVQFRLDRFVQSKDMAGLVEEMIIASQHDTIPWHVGTQVFCDLDLSILGQTESAFDKYEEQIRQEYDWVPEQNFIRGRLAVLRMFLDRQHIYSTKFFREKYEKRARRNLTRSIAQLSGRLQS
jgi:predicted metal-dependent HD superfamily phosphohydrolase